MSVRQVIIGSTPVLVEVDDGSPEGLIQANSGGASTREKTSSGSPNKLSGSVQQIDGLVSALAGQLVDGVSKLGPDEWSVEVNIGFKGEAGIPFITKGEANGAVKVSLKWKKA